MTEMQITYKNIEDLIPYARNSRTHSDEQIAQIAASIKEFGWRNPVLIDGDNGIIAGHGRVLAARKLNFDQVPTIDGSDMTDVQKRMYVIADNKLALNAEWDNEFLKLELEEFDDAFLELSGFSEKELSNILGVMDDEDIKEPSDESRNLIMVELMSERECETLFTELQERGFECKIMS
jgi:ParB-like chromosome segregation protein Spo0J